MDAGSVFYKELAHYVLDVGLEDIRETDFTYGDQLLLHCLLFINLQA